MNKKAMRESEQEKDGREKCSRERESNDDELIRENKMEIVDWFGTFLCQLFTIEIRYNGVFLDGHVVVRQAMSAR